MTQLNKEQLNMAEVYDAIYPVGTVYTNATDSRNPATIFGFGTWSAIEGEVVVGYKSGDTNFGTPGASVGTAAVTLTAAQSGVPVHRHGISVKNDDFNFTGTSLGVGPTFADAKDGASVLNTFQNIVVDNTAQNASQAHTNIQPSRICYVWKRTA